jgi:hypothetical protein
MFQYTDISELPFTSLVGAALIKMKKCCFVEAYEKEKTPTVDFSRLYSLQVNLPPNPPQKATPGEAVKPHVKADRSKIEAPT